MESDPVLEKQFRGHKEAVTALAFHPLNNQLTSSSKDHSLMLWNSGKHLRSFKFHGHSDAVMDISFNKTGKILASVSRDKTVRLWVPLVTGETVDFKAHGQTVRSVHFSPCGTKLLTGSDDKMLKLWSVARRKFLQSFVDHTNWVRCARFSKDGAMIASCSDDKTVKLWDPDNGKPIHTYQERKGQCNYVAWHPSGTYIAVALSNGTVKLYDTRTHCLLQHYRVHNAAVTQICFHPIKNFLLTSSLDSSIKVLDLLEGAPLYTLSGHESGVTAVAFSADGENFATGGEDRRVMVWKTNFLNNIENADKENAPLNELYHVEDGENKNKKVVEPQPPVESCSQGRSETIIVNDRPYTPPDEEIIEVGPRSTPNQRSFRDIDNMEDDDNQFPRTPPTPETLSIPNIPPLELRANPHVGTAALDVQVEMISKRSRLSSQTPGAKKQCPDESETNCTESAVPALKAIVHHIGALHNAVTIAEERISLLEDVFNKT